MRRRTWIAIATGCVTCLGLTGCGGGDEPAASTSPPPPQKAAAPPAATVQQISQEAKRCLDLVRQKLYADAITPCESALEQSANADVERAYAEAKEAVEAAAKRAAITAAADSLSGKPADQAAKDAVQGELGGLGGK